MQNPVIGYTTYTSKSLGGLVVDKDFANGFRTRAVIKADGSAVIHSGMAAGKLTVSSYGKKGKAYAAELLAEAKAFFA